MFSRKYFWRDWYVIAYKKQSNKNHYSRICGEQSNSYDYLWQDKYHVIIYSSPKGESVKKFDGYLNKYTPERDFEGRKYSVHIEDGHTYESEERSNLAPAKSIYQLLPTKARSCVYPIVLIVKDGVDVSMQVPEDCVRSHTYSARVIRYNKRWYWMRENKINQVYIFS